MTSHLNTMTKKKRTKNAKTRSMMRISRPMPAMRIELKRYLTKTYARSNTKSK